MAAGNGNPAYYNQQRISGNYYMKIYETDMLTIQTIIL